jgi:hypothetical protein
MPRLAGGGLRTMRAGCLENVARLFGTTRNGTMMSTEAGGLN